MKGVLLGPQQLRLTFKSALRSLTAQGALPRDASVALVTAGWQEREDQDEPFPRYFGRRVVNLKLYERGEQVFREDAELAKAHRARQDQLRQIQEFYRLRLERHFDAALDIERKTAGTQYHADEVALSMAQTNRLDEEHLQRVNELRLAYEKETKPTERDAIVRHRAELVSLLNDVSLVAIAGGHVAVLLNRLRLFGLADLMGDRALMAWSGGAMVTSERVVLFHESPPEGAGISEVLEQGLTFHRGVLPLPDPRLRLKLDDTFRVSWMARRYPHSRCVAFDHGEYVLFDGDSWFGAEGTTQLLADGSLNPAWAQTERRA